MEKCLLLGMRGTGLISKFALVAWLTVITSLEEVGFYSAIVAAAVVYSKFAGLGVGLKAGRASKSEMRNAMRDALGVFGMVYAMTMLALLALAGVGALRAEIVMPLWFVLVGEHLGLEVGTVMLIRGYVLPHNILLFVRTTGWVGAVAGLHYAGVYYISETFDLLWVWGGAALATAAFGAWYAECKCSWIYAGVAAPREMVKHIKESWLLLVSLTMFVGCSVVERLVGASAGHWAALGAFSLHWSFMNAALTLVQSSIIQPSLRALADACGAGDASEIGKAVKRLDKEVAVVGAAGLVVVGVLSNIGLAYVGLGGGSMPGFLICGLGMAMALRMLNEVRFQSLWLMGCEKDIALGSLTGLIAGIGVGIALIFDFGISALVASALVASICVLFMFERGLQRGLDRMRAENGSR